MKSFLSFIVLIPCFAFGLETVNLLKDASFEKDSELWQTRAGSVWATEDKKDSAIASRHDSLSSTDGSFAASADTRTKPGWNLDSGSDSAIIVYTGFLNKKISDLDSLIWDQKMISKRLNPNLNEMCFVTGLFLDASQAGWFEYGYLYQTDVYNHLTFPRWTFEYFYTPDDTLWLTCLRSLKVDLIDVRKYSPQTTVDSFILMGWGNWATPSVWYGQKIYWDDIRLTGYADYDVGVKGLLSGDSVWKNTGYTPTAHIKNFGRKPADTFLVVAEIKGGSGTVYADTLPYALPADTEDTVSFKEFKPSDAANYTLTVSTLMTPDESDEDDEMSKALYGTGITETPSPSSLQLEVTALSSVRYFLPSGEQGTLTLYDPSGRRIESYRVQGEGQVAMKSSLSSGVYFVKLEAGKASVTKKAVVLR